MPLLLLLHMNGLRLFDLSTCNSSNQFRCHNGSCTKRTLWNNLLDLDRDRRNFTSMETSSYSMNQQCTKCQFIIKLSITIELPLFMELRHMFFENCLNKYIAIYYQNLSYFFYQNIKTPILFVSMKAHRTKRMIDILHYFAILI